MYGGPIEKGQWVRLKPKTSLTFIRSRGRPKPGDSVLSSCTVWEVVHVGHDFFAITSATSLWLIDIDDFRANLLSLADAQTREAYLAQFNTFENEGDPPVLNERGRKGRYCPDCGACLESAKRYCLKCAEKRRRKTKRESQAKARRGVDS